MVTYNTLIDVYGKMGNWQDAVRVLDEMTEQVTAAPAVLPHAVLVCLLGELAMLMAVYL